MHRNSRVHLENSNPQKEKEWVIELILNSQTFHNNRIADEQFRQILQALLDKVIINMQPSIFSGAKGEVGSYIILVD